MNKTAIKNFAIWGRNKLISDISYKAGLLGIDEKGIKDPLSQSNQEVQFFDIGTPEPYSITGNEIKQRERLVEQINNKAKESDYFTAYHYIIEEVAYTWFNRLIAIRFMEVNDYLPSRIRVLSSESHGKTEPDIVTNPFDTDLEFSISEKETVLNSTHHAKLDELFRMLFIKQCNKLNEVLPHLFEKTNDYSELLLKISFTDKEGIVYHLVNDIVEEDFKEAVEIIGWMYQYYNEERKNKVINIYKGTIKKEDIPAATQLFTTDWVVRYMVDNSLGRYWLERNPKSQLKDKLQYFLSSKKEEIHYIDEKISPEELTFFDPCMGSGHILVYAFDVLMEIYKERGYSERDAASLIIQNNIFGLDIDKRSYQLAYFALMMRARSYDRRFFTRKVLPKVYEIEETNNIGSFSLEKITTNEEQNIIGEYLVKTFKDAKEIGSLLNIENKDYSSFENYLNSLEQKGQMDFESVEWFNIIYPLMKKVTKQAQIMSKKYKIVCTNPPYMNKMEGRLKKYVIENYKDYSGDLFSVFMHKNFDYCVDNGYSAFMTPFVWMFIKTYEKIRNYIVKNKSITSLIQMEYSAFEEATVPICTFILKNGKDKNKGLYIKLSEFRGGMEVQRKKVIEAINDPECTYFYETNEENFKKIPGMPIAYWASAAIINVFENKKIVDYAYGCNGLTTGDNNLWLRFWAEVPIRKICFNACTNEVSAITGKKWFPYNKGGNFRKWYGNNDYVINWEQNGAELRNSGHLVSRSMKYQFRQSISWSKISSGNIGFRMKEAGHMFDVAGLSLFVTDNQNWKYIIGFCNSKVALSFAKILSPTLNYEVGHITSFPMIIDETQVLGINDIVYSNISISRDDWDSFETSWDFEMHPLLKETPSISEAYEHTKQEYNNRFTQLKTNEEELNRIFIDIYGLQDELTPDVEDKDITVYSIFDSKDTIPESMKKSRYALTKENVIKSFISYAVGCMFGRYSLDMKGLAYAGGEWDDSKYSTFIPDKDNIIPITDEEYLEDDIVGLFTAFVKKVYGEDTLEENLDFIAEALGNKGDSSRETIRNYVIKDFFKDHCNTYSVTGSGKRPIYWLFDSGKENGFKALIYMHRYNEDTIGNIRIDYLHRMQRIYESEIQRMQEIIDHSLDGREKVIAEKRKEKLLKQIKETKEYDEKIAHLALARIGIDLDDGVKVNYEKVQTDTNGKKLEVLAKI